MGVLHPYWVQVALYVQYDFAKQLHDDLVKNEWAVPDTICIGGIDYESPLSDKEIEIIAYIEMGGK